ncbi:MAG: putative glycosylase [Verrucomicrobiales bacterium]|nr:putative glycosylase [Verrucomicrobiales bacterium]
MNVIRLPITLRPDASRVLIRPFWPAPAPGAHHNAGTPRALHIICRILSLTEEEVIQQYDITCADFDKRHHSIEQYFLRRYQEVAQWVPTDAVISQTRKLLIGAYFTQEYSIEAAALFNPSIVPCPDQEGVPAGGLRFVLTLRAVGEGHISSICFRCGVITPDFQIELGDPARWVVEPVRDVDASFEKEWFESKSVELGMDGKVVSCVMDALPAEFTEAELVKATRNCCGPNLQTEAERMLMLAKSNFHVRFDEQQRYSERAIFPISPSQINGIEDARFVKFDEGDGTSTFYATYTAYDGRMIFPQILETKDFLHFHFRTLRGAAVQNKGMALFPRKVNGRYVMLSRQDNENIRIMFSDDLYCWETSEILVRPTQPWEFLHMGNCGSPLELDEGWLVLTHGVGAMRKYCIGALLLDKEDPTRIIGRLAEPLIRPLPHEREGYVPNVVYSCGSIIFNRHLLLPYATSDWFTSFAVMALDELVQAMLPANGTVPATVPITDSTPQACAILANA